MSLNLTGIINQNEFYSAHYLSDILEGDVKEVLSQWSRRAKEEKDFRAPWDALGGLRQMFFESRRELEQARGATEVLDLQQPFNASLLHALGYPVKREVVAAAERSIPVLCNLRRTNGSPLLWAVEVAPVNGRAGENGEANPLDLNLLPEQYPENIPDDARALDATLEELLDDEIFRMDEPPRWVLLLSHGMAVLVDRGKWQEKRLLGFDLREILDRRESSTLRAMAALLHRDSVAPAEGGALLDTLDERSHRHAYAVSEDLKFSMREAVELLGNEAVRYLLDVRREKVYGVLDAAELSRECLRYVYRLLFLFYIEARPELGYAPMNSEEYLRGYSLESLRDLEMLPLTTEEARDGVYIHNSLQHLFTLVYEGYNHGYVQMPTEAQHDTFVMPPLRSHLFDPARTPVLGRVKFRNEVLQRIIRLMSLSRPKKGKRPGRISYAQLGINQLGAVYEGLLSYTGFFAEEDVYEVKRKGTNPTPLEEAYFVTLDELDKYRKDEQVLGEDGRVKRYERGSFIYRLTGRGREQSASYYTPEVLTECLVKYALKELLKDKRADDILELAVCEPAMGSAAFLNEYVNQAAEAYLRLKQKESGRVIPHGDYVQEKQKVKAWLADNCCYGVDLNAVAVELAEVSLWLNTIHRESIVPWFGNQLVTGNSLIGARRQVFPAASLKKSRGQDAWLEQVPERVEPGDERPVDTVYHWMLPDRGMAEYNDRVVKSLVKDDLDAIKEWKKSFIAPFGKEEITTLQRLCAAADELYEEHLRMRASIDERTRDDMDIFGHERDGGHRQRLTLKEKDAILEGELYAEGLRNSSPYRRLKLAMDYWCALWFWPIDEAATLPTRAQYLADLALILEGKEVDSSAPPQSDLFAESMPEQLRLELLQRHGIVDVNELCRENPRLGLARRIADDQNFLHWELEFAEVFAQRGGFDLVLGNPPWIRIEWNEAAVIGDYEPLYVVRKHRANKVAQLRDETFERIAGLLEEYLDAFTTSEGTQNFLNAYQNYPLLVGMKANLYKCFLPQAWMTGNAEGVSAFLHPEGVYDDPMGGEFRQSLYRRIRKHFQFENEFKLFEDVDNHTKYSVNVYSRMLGDTVSFDHISNLFLPRTVDECYADNGAGKIPGIKTKENKWDTAGHKDRIIQIGIDELALFARLYDEEGTQASEARLPILHAQELLNVLRKFAEQPQRLGDLEGEYYSTQHWNEVNAQQDGTMRRETRFPKSANELILSGPHFYVANPAFKTPRSICNTNRAYDVLDLTDLPEDYLPRTNYVPDCSSEEYRRRTPRVPWGEKKRVTEYYRTVHRKMIGPSAERTLIGAVMVRYSAHYDGAFSTTFKDTSTLLLYSGLTSSIPYDFFVKSTGKSNFRNEISDMLPISELHADPIISRVLKLVCITNAYAELWKDAWEPRFTRESWMKLDPRLDANSYRKMVNNWSRDSGLRTDYERRQALIELDVFAAKSLNLSLEELQTIYRIQFPVLHQYEQDTWYDRKGRIVFTVSKGLPGVGVDRKTWEEIRHMQEGETFTVEREDDTLPGGPRLKTITYHAPFDRCDREEDYRTAWKELEQRRL